MVGTWPQPSDATAVANSNIRLADTPRIGSPSGAFLLLPEIQIKQATGALNVRSTPTICSGWGRSVECDDGGAPASGFRRCVAKPGHKGCPGKHGADDFALRSDAAPMDDAQGAVAHPARFDEVFFHDGAYVPGRDGVQVEHIGDRNANGFVVLCPHEFPMWGGHSWLPQAGLPGGIACPTPIFKEAPPTKSPAPNGAGQENYAITVTPRT